MKRKHSLQKRCGGGFVVNFKPPQVDNYVGESEEVEVGGASKRADIEQLPSGVGGAAGTRRPQLSEPVDDA